MLLLLILLVLLFFVGKSLVGMTLAAIGGVIGLVLVCAVFMIKRRR